MEFSSFHNDIPGDILDESTQKYIDQLRLLTDIQIDQCRILQERGIVFRALKTLSPFDAKRFEGAVSRPIIYALEKPPTDPLVTEQYSAGICFEIISAHRSRNQPPRYIQVRIAEVFNGISFPAKNVVDYFLDSDAQTVQDLAANLHYAKEQSLLPDLSRDCTTIYDTTASDKPFRIK